MMSLNQKATLPLSVSILGYVSIKAAKNACINFQNALSSWVFDASEKKPSTTCFYKGVQWSLLSAVSGFSLYYLVNQFWETAPYEPSVETNENNTCLIEFHTFQLLPEHALVESATLLDDYCQSYARSLISFVGLQNEQTKSANPDFELESFFQFNRELDLAFRDLKKDSLKSLTLCETDFLQKKEKNQLEIFPGVFLKSNYLCDIPYFATYQPKECKPYLKLKAGYLKVLALKEKLDQRYQIVKATLSPHFCSGNDKLLEVLKLNGTSHETLVTQMAQKFPKKNYHNLNFVKMEVSDGDV